jgi:hypothetical protein
MKVLLGILILFFLVVSSYFLYKLSSEAIVCNSIESINSLNKRIDDLCILGSVVVTLLLGITVLTFINAEKKAQKEASDFIDKNIKTYVDDAKAKLEEAKTNLSIIKDLRKAAEDVSQNKVSTHS